MKAVFQLFWQMCLLRQSPEYVPTHRWFVAAVVAANLITSMVVSTALDTTTDTLSTVTRVVVSQATTAALLWLALYLREYATRFPATLTALFGCDLIMTACFGAVVPIFSAFSEGSLTFLSLGFLIWSLAVSGYILHRALSVALAIGILIALGMMVFSISTSQIAIGAP